MVDYYKHVFEKCSTMFECTECSNGTNVGNCQLSKESKVYCTSKHCPFETRPSLNCFYDHCKTMHYWKEYPCSFEDCKFVGYNSQSYQAHLVSFHARHTTYASQAFSCTWPNCQAGFDSKSKLKNHVNIHSNELLQCVFCPYRTSQDAGMILHYRFHYRVFDAKCEYCDKKFTNQSMLNRHHLLEHSKDIFTCHICNSYSGSRLLLQAHILKKHKLLSKWNETKMIFETFTRQ